MQSEALQSSWPKNGRIDIHSHLLSGVDDGCADLAESLACIRLLKQAGYAGSICTPHIWPQRFKLNIPNIIDKKVLTLQNAINQANLQYTLWSGGELRMCEGIVQWMQEFGVPTLGNTRCVLVDCWETHWPKHVKKTLTWLQAQNYQPIFAHPERTPCCWDQLTKLLALKEQGIWFQGNFRPLTGEDGFQAQEYVHQYLQANLYNIMALDMHTQKCLPSRLDGLQLVAQEYGQELADYFTIAAPRQYLQPKQSQTI